MTNYTLAPSKYLVLPTLYVLQDALSQTDADHPDRYYLHNSADCLWKFLKARDKSINACLQMCGVYIEPPPNRQVAMLVVIANRQIAMPVVIVNWQVAISVVISNRQVAMSVVIAN